MGILANKVSVSVDSVENLATKVLVYISVPCLDEGSFSGNRNVSRDGTSSCEKWIL